MLAILLPILSDEISGFSPTLHGMSVDVPEFCLEIEGCILKERIEISNLSLFRLPQINRDVLVVVPVFFSQLLIGNQSLPDLGPDGLVIGSHKISVGLISTGLKSPNLFQHKSLPVFNMITRLTPLEAALFEFLSSSPVLVDFLSEPPLKLSERHFILFFEEFLLVLAFNITRFEDELLQAVAHEEKRGVTAHIVVLAGA